MIKLKDILSEAPTKKKELGKFVFADPNQSISTSSADKFKMLQGTNEYEPNTDLEQEILIQLLLWTRGSTSDIQNKFKELEPHFKRWKNEYPKIFDPKLDDNTPLFRGMRSTNDYFKNIVQKAEKENWNYDSDWDMMVYKGGLDYHPRKYVQSWTTNPNVAKLWFTDENKLILITLYSDSNFYLNQDVLDIMFSDEQEILHFGEKYSKPFYLAMKLDKYFSLYIENDTDDKFDQIKKFYASLGKEFYP